MFSQRLVEPTRIPCLSGTRHILGLSLCIWHRTAFAGHTNQVSRAIIYGVYRHALQSFSSDRCCSLLTCQLLQPSHKLVKPYMVLHYRLEDSNILDKYQDSNNVDLCLFLDFESRVLLGLMALVEAFEGICLGGATVVQSDVDP